MRDDHRLHGHAALGQPERESEGFAFVPRAAPRRISQVKTRQPDCADPLPGLLLRYSLDGDAATAIENAINRALEEGVRTGDLARGTAAVSTDEMGDIIARYVAEGV